MTAKLQSMMQSHCNETLRLLNIGSAPNSPEALKVCYKLIVDVYNKLFTNEHNLFHTNILQYFSDLQNEHFIFCNLDQ